MTVAQPEGSKWRCPLCEGSNVQISLPVWFLETQDGGLHRAESADSDADPLAWFCEDCDECGPGVPDLNDRDKEVMP